RYGESGRTKDLVAGTLGAAVGFLVKGPYGFYLMLPVVYVQLTRSERGRAVISTNACGGALRIGLPWCLDPQAVNRQAPDLSFIRGYESTADRLDFYVGGQSDERLSIEPWRTIGVRVRDEIAARYWWPLVPIAFFWPGMRRMKMLAAVWTLC